MQHQQALHVFVAELEAKALNLPVDSNFNYLVHEFWMKTERVRSQIQAAKMSFLHRLAVLSEVDRSALHNNTRSVLLYISFAVQRTELNHGPVRSRCGLPP